MAVLLEQRYEDQKEALRVFMDGRQADIWTAIPGIIVSFNAIAITAVVQPVIQELYTGADLTQKFINLPQLLDVPIVFPRGGVYTLTFPIQPNDECLVVFSSRCIDNWWAQGGIQNQYEKRMHDLSDGFAFVGPFSQQTKIQNISTTTTQFRTNDGTIFVELDLPNKVSRIINNGLEVTLNADTNTGTVTAPTVTINASTQTNVNTPLAVFSGTITASGDITAGSGGGGSVDLLGHVHSDSGGTNDSGPPVPGS
jgi:Phage protein Gp138 N-terminal domain